jgi:hypothetical protein
VISRGVCRAVVGLALVAAVSACDDNPLAENREDASYFRLNPSNAAVNVGGEIRVNANVMNRYGAALATSVTATECNSNITVAPHPDRSDYEYPETFLVTGVTVGTSCIVVRGGGVTDTVTIRVVPASIGLSVADTLVPSGQTVPLSVVYRNATGGNAPGVAFDTLRTTFVVRTAATGAIDRQGNFTGQAPGQTWVVASFTDMGVTRRDSVSLRVVAGPFTGTFTPNPIPSAGSIMTFTAGAVPFDDDTNVTFNSIPSPFVLTRNATTLSVVVPGGVTASTVYAITNMGPNQLAVGGNVAVTNPTVDAYEPNNSFGTATVLPNQTGSYYFTMSGTDEDDYYRLNLTEQRSVTFNVTWNEPNTLVTLLIADGTGTYLPSAQQTCYAAARPTACTFTLPAGTWYVNIWYYGAVSGSTTFTGVTQYPALTGRMNVTFN